MKQIVLALGLICSFTSTKMDLCVPKIICTKIIEWRNSLFKSSGLALQGKKQEKPKTASEKPCKKTSLRKILNRSVTKL
jgi:hypothetical protein